jgi:hypothetical protein
MEKASNRSVIPRISVGRSGQLEVTDGVLAPDSEANRTIDKGRAIFVNSKNCTVFAEGARSRWWVLKTLW